MIPSAADIATARWRLTAWLRVGGLAALFMSIPATMSWLAEGLRDDDLWEYGYYAGRMVLGLGGALAGIAIFALAPPLARMLLPVPVATECPRCRYSLAGAGGDRCPECGLPVGAAFIIASLPHTGRRRGRRSRLLDEISSAAILLGAAWSVLLAVIAAIVLTAVLGVVGFLIGIVAAAPILASQLLALRLGIGGRSAPAPEAAPDGTENSA